MSTTASRAGDTEGTILARVFDNERGLLPRDLARSIVGVEFSEWDKAQMHDLAVRNQNDSLSPKEKEELLAFAKAGTLLSILQSKARRTLKIKPKKRTSTRDAHECGVDPARVEARESLLRITHFPWEGAYLACRTRSGRVLGELLRINDPFRVELREELIAQGLFDPE